MSSFEELAVEVAGKNINTTTLLATDYLNHFNEIIMILEMVPDMPDMLEECKNWQPKTYVQHFADSSFSNKELAIKAYDYVPTKFKKAFEYVVGEINRIILQSMDKMEELKESPEELREFCRRTFADLHTLTEATGGVINGYGSTETQKSVDTISFTADP